MPRLVFNVLTYAPMLIYLLVLFILFVSGKISDDEYEYDYKLLTPEQKKAILKQNLVFALLLVYYVVMSIIEFFVYER